MFNNHELNRFEREENDALVFARYSVTGETLLIHHVEAAPKLRGTGAADRLMREIVAHAQNDQKKIFPLCGYASTWLRRHARHIIATP